MDPKPTACLVLSDGTIFYGNGFGKIGNCTAELCFNTAMTGYQEIITDPSYAGQLITFTFPHIGNTGVNIEDDESTLPFARGIIVKWNPTEPSNWRNQKHFSDWLKNRGLIGLGNIDTRRLTRAIRSQGAPNVSISYNPEGHFDINKMVLSARNHKGLLDQDLAIKVTCKKSYKWTETKWVWPKGYSNIKKSSKNVVAIDYGAKRNILRCLASTGCNITVVPANSTITEIISHKPDGVFLSNGPGDPAATGKYSVPLIKELLDRSIPIFGICLGHQMLALALDAKTVKMNHGHHGANHPVKDLESGKVEITSMNHGFAVDRQSLPNNVTETHISLFDGSNCGIRADNHKAFSVQYHPEASPGPQDSYYLFEKFIELMANKKESGAA